MFHRKKESSGRSAASDENDPVHRGWNLSVQRLAVFILVFRLVNSFVIQTSFVPDEYWQTLEVAHGSVFGYGYQTWEWRTGLRGYTYPLIFASLFKLLQFLHLDYPVLLTFLPCALQATFSAGQDVALYLLSRRLHGDRAAWWTLFCYLSSWFAFYTATRTLTNTMETVCTTVGILCYPWHGHLSRNRGEIRFCFMFAALACVIRPTAAIIWFPLALWYLVKTERKMVTILQDFLPIGSLVLCCSILIDRFFYGKWVFVQYNFLEFNVLHDMGSFYGSHPWHWYLTQGLPVILGAHLPLVMLGVKETGRKLLSMKLLIFWVIFVYSFLSHKEFRFILPVLPMCMLFCGLFISQCRHSTQRLLAIYLLVLNVPVALYTGLLHQRGTLDVMTFLRQELRSEVTSVENKEDVLFLMPCHSTPFYSHLHSNVSLKFLTCHPNLEHITDYVDEADLFYENPQKWLEKNFASFEKYPSYIVMFNVLQERVKSFLDKGKYGQVAEFFHTHFPEGRVGRYVLVFHRKTDNAR
ncbi:GPI mannosyltransferase 3 [Holothuria leucospilota]|uniref:Mannosyltransferase n=1 Tax=Holothuria leucospilota TaxID=206669 RepID=A0A9Q1BLZ2_HOLLE|nr:GPI mannosyltransferase 3 [Holothuria leucospilota]